MNVGVAGVSAATTLIAVALGGWLTVRAQDRLWRRDHQRQWRDIRLDAYTGYLTAFREFIAYVLRPTTRVLTTPQPGHAKNMIPIFDDVGGAYKEQLEATKTTVRLVASNARVVRASNAMVACARNLAAERASHDVGAIASERFESLWSSEREFVLAAREELGLVNDFEIGDRPLSGRGGVPDEASISPLAAWIPDAQPQEQP